MVNCELPIVNSQLTIILFLDISMASRVLVSAEAEFLKSARHGTSSMRSHQPDQSRRLNSKLKHRTEEVKASIQKPYKPDDILIVLREVLDEDRPAHAFQLILPA
jgi:hypothetical protein